AIDWFKTLPLWLDLEGLRVVHACWDSVQINRIMQNYGNDALLTDELLHAAARRSSWQFRAVEILLKGKEISLPKGTYFYDKNGIRRHDIRMRWWASGNTYKDLCLGSERAHTNIPDDPVLGDHLVEYGREEKPVFLGHYWMDGEPVPLAENVACLDYSVANPGGKLVAYRWNGEQKINPDNFVSLERFD
ncbi:MAG: metallophosphoesterase, partial [Alphaproteobacteria bacterium]